MQRFEITYSLKAKHKNVAQAIVSMLDTLTSTDYQVEFHRQDARWSYKTETWKNFEELDNACFFKGQTARGNYTLRFGICTSEASAEGITTDGMAKVDALLATNLATAITEWGLDSEGITKYLGFATAMKAKVNTKHEKRINDTAKYNHKSKLRQLKQSYIDKLDADGIEIFQKSFDDLRETIQYRNTNYYRSFSDELASTLATEFDEHRKLINNKYGIVTEGRYDRKKSLLKLQTGSIFCGVFNDSSREWRESIDECTENLTEMNPIDEWESKVKVVIYSDSGYSDTPYTIDVGTTDEGERIGKAIVDMQQLGIKLMRKVRPVLAELAVLDAEIGKMHYEANLAYLEEAKSITVESFREGAIKQIENKEVA
tara:strand:+ start:2162 stop:3277 length:1116 start_codon:yes stop_codon:yes gene_type:complete